EKRLALETRRRRAVQKLLEHRDGLFRIGVLQRPDRHQLDLFVGLVLGTYRLTSPAPHFDFQRFRVLEVTAVRVGLGQFGNRRQRLGSKALTVLRVGFPVQRRVDLRAFHVDHATEVADGAVPAALVHRVLTLLVGLGFALMFALFALGLALLLLAFAILALGLAFL